MSEVMNDKMAALMKEIDKVQKARKAITDKEGKKRGIGGEVKCPNCENGTLRYSITTIQSALAAAETDAGKIADAFYKTNDPMFMKALSDEEQKEVLEVRNELAGLISTALLAEREKARREIFAEPDYWYCDIDPDESGDSPYEAMHHHRPSLEPIKLHSSYVGPTKWGVMSPSKTDAGEEAHLFDTQEEAETFCKQERALAEVKS